MQSKSFMRDILHFIDSEFEKDYSKSRDCKLSTVLEKCYDFVEFDKEAGFQKVVDYIETNKRCKLPWSSRELQTAKATVMKLINGKRKQK